MGKKLPEGDWGLIILAIVLILAAIFCLLERIGQGIWPVG